MHLDYGNDLAGDRAKRRDVALGGVILMQGQRLLVRLDLDLLKGLVECSPSTGGTQLIKHGLLRRQDGRWRRSNAGRLCSGYNHLRRPRVVGNDEVREIANARILRCLERQLP